MLSDRNFNYNQDAAYNIQSPIPKLQNANYPQTTKNQKSLETQVNASIPEVDMGKLQSLEKIYLQKQTLNSEAQGRKKSKQKKYATNNQYDTNEDDY